MLNETNNGAATMTATEIFDAAFAKATETAGYQLSTNAMRAAAEAGLVDGDRIDLGVRGGLHLFARVTGDVVRFEAGERVTEVPVAALPAAQINSMLINKVIAAGRSGFTGHPTF